MHTAAQSILANVRTVLNGLSNKGTKEGHKRKGLSNTLQDRLHFEALITALIPDDAAEARTER